MSVEPEVLSDLRGASGALGEAQAFVHVAGYSFGLGFAKIKWLLQEDRWRHCGFETIEAFAASIQFDKSMRAAAEQRKELVALFKTADIAKPISNRQIAKALNVDERSVRRDAANAASGEETTSKNKGASDVAAANAAPSLPSGERAARMISNKSEGQAAKADRRATREADLAAKQTALPDKRYGVILADPEWKFETYSEAGMDRSADNHYPTSELDEIKARGVASIAADDCVLFLWATAPMMPQALAVMLAWGFTYKSQVVWTKDRVGTGYWFRNKHEILLVGTRGEIPAPAPGTQWGSVINAPVGEHSAKPAEFMRMIEQYFPTLSKIELNARALRPGWDRWGNEAPVEEAR